MRRAIFVSICCTVLLVGVVAASAMHSTSTRGLAIPRAPAFTASQLNASPAENWLTIAGDLKNDRYSSLKQITPANVSTLKQAWHIHLGTCATHDQKCGSYEGNTIVYRGVYYISTPKSDVFALDAATGAKLWRYTPTLDRGFPPGSVQRQPGSR